MKQNHNNYLRLAFNIAQVNLGRTKTNPSVGCVVVKNNSVISSGCTSLNGRPHAEFNALNKNKNFKNSDLYVTMEPCDHHGLTPPCTKIIIRKGINRVYYSFDDIDIRTVKKGKKKLIKNKIKVYKKRIKDFSNFYQSYFLISENKIPLIDAKIAISKDFFTVNQSSKWITNSFSRKRTHLIRSRYDAIVSTSKSINKDNSVLNCRIKGLDNNKPDLVIIDLNLKIKKTLEIFKKPSRRKIYIVTSIFDKKKFSYFKKKKIEIIRINTLKEKDDFINFFKILKKRSYNRILIESGLIFLNQLLKNKLISNLYIFQSPVKLGKIGKNNTSNYLIKKFKLKNRIKVNLSNDNLYKLELNNV
tara:strand:+ start:260 stop:1336 length:1077 start_codon:yes stop_codon:yes gene_type:complete